MMSDREDGLIKALEDIAAGNNVPDEMLQSKEYFQEHFGSFLQYQARDALARYRRDDPKEAE